MYIYIYRYTHICTTEPEGHEKGFQRKALQEQQVYSEGVTGLLGLFCAPSFACMDRDVGL